MKCNEEVGHSTPMHLAAEHGLIYVMEKFIDLGGDMTAVDNKGFSCLHLACQQGHYDMVKFLLAKGNSSIVQHVAYLKLICVGADENLKDKFGYNAAYWAQKSKYTDIVELLPPPQKRTHQELYEYITQVWKVHNFKPGKGGKKKKKGKKKKR